MPVNLPDDEPYVLLPTGMAQDLRDSPLAVSIYLLIGRSYLVHHKPIPLSTADINAYDGSDTLRRGAILRAIDRLCGAGWLITQRRRGQKSSYLPAWGIVGDAARPWDLAATSLGRPRTMRAVRVPRIIMDVCMGRLTPQQRHPALIDRYVTRPVLSLYDVGSYGLLWAGIASSTPALIQIGLAGAAGPLTPPSWGALLARISQRPLFDADPTAPMLSPRGLERAGFSVTNPPDAPEETPLFFVPPDMIGDMIPHMIPELIGDMIGGGGVSDHADSASEPATSPATPGAQPAAGNLGTQGSEANRATSSSSAPAPDMFSRSSRRRERPDRRKVEDSPPADPAAAPQPATAIPPATPPTPAEQALCALGVYPSIARRYRDMAPALITRATTIAQRTPGCKSIPATVALLLREEQASPGWLRQERLDLSLGPMADVPSVNDSGAGASAASDADPRSHIHAALCATLEPAIHLYIAREQIMIDGQTMLIKLPDWFSDDERAAVDSVLSTAAAQLGLRCHAHDLDTNAPAVQEAAAPKLPPAQTSADAHAERPAWIDAEQWAQLHLLARSSLVGSWWEGEQIIGASPGITRMLRTQLSGLVARLRAPLDASGEGVSAADCQAG